LWSGTFSSGYLNYHVYIVSSLKSEVDKLIGKYKRASPIILDVNNEQERLEELVKGHDLVVR